MRIPRPRARASRAVVSVLLLAATFLAIPTGSAKGDPDVDPLSASQSNVNAPTPELKALFSDDPAEGLPGFDDLPAHGSIGLGEGTVTNSQHAVARRSKLSITSRPIWGAMIFAEFNTPIESPTSYTALCILGRHCLSDPFYQPSCATDDPATHWRTNYFRSPMYPIKPLKGGGAKVGILSEQKVNLLAFGAIPATATLTVSAPRVNGKVQPLDAHVWGRMPGGCAPRPSDIPAVSTLLEGEINLQLSDLEVDGVPAELGSRCRTNQPTQLYLWGNSTGPASTRYAPGSGGPLAAIDGLHPGSRGPLNDPYYLEDNGREIPASSGLNIPPFANCGTGGEDLSPLVTAMASGPNNPVRVTQSKLVPVGRIPLEDLRMCVGGNPQHGIPPLCPLPAPEIPEMPPLPDDEGQ